MLQNQLIVLHAPDEIVGALADLYAPIGLIDAVRDRQRRGEGPLRGVIRGQTHAALEKELAGGPRARRRRGAVAAEANVAVPAGR